MKKCRICNLEKELNEFSKRSENLYRNECKICRSNSSKKYNQENRDKILERKKVYNAENKERKKEYDSQRYDKEYNNKRGAEWRKRNKKRIKEYHIKHKEKRKEYLMKNNEKLREGRKEYCEKNREKIITYRKEYRSKNKHLFAWRNMLHSVLRRMFKIKSNRTIECLGYSAEKFKLRIECQFKKGMSWGNYGEWHIDHKKPVSFFDKDTPMSVVNCLCNLQPLWAFDNLSKGNKLNF